MFEKRKQRLISRKAFHVRFLNTLAIALLLLFFALFLGMLGYHYLEDLDWIDSFLNASMILGGMGPVAELKTVDGKIFAGCYALFSGIFFLGLFGIIAAPILHRALHRFHLENEGNN